MARLRTGFLILAICIPATAIAQVPTKLFSEMGARSIGPAGMSGRIAAVEAVVSDPNTIYVGAATGGLWKTTGGGTSWQPIFDNQQVSSIGAIGIFQANPDIVWVGTGEGNPRNSSSVGIGVFKSLDAGRSWQAMGLAKTEKIHRVLTHPSDPNTVYVAALGTTWDESSQRGVYKTTDGGKSWQQVLFVNNRTGCADLVMDPNNPNKLLAAMWEHRRWPWHFKSGGPGSGLHITYDGGLNWKRLTSDDGLPAGELGRTGIAIARSNPRVVYALVEAEKSALCRSDDGGQSWSIVNQETGINPLPFYYADIRVDPTNENRIYRLQSLLDVSEDGGRNFRALLPFARVHPDHHALWIHPHHGRLLINGNDGGIAISQDRGDSWRFVENLALAQFYHINIDMEFPFNVYGGMQDNGSWRGPSELWENGDIRNYHWEEVGFGDGFATLSDPTDPQSGYSMSQGGYLQRFHRLTGQRRDIRPPEPDDTRLRFNWNAGIAINPFDPSSLYYGSQFVHRSNDRGENWTIISPDLTTNAANKQRQSESGGLTRDVTAAENFTAILTIAPSPVERGVIWVGTDDGNVQVTRDNGESWTNVADRIPRLPTGTWCPHIEASKFDAATAFAVFDDHRRSNWTTYIYVTRDYGQTWHSLTGDASDQPSDDKLWGFVHVIEQDPVQEDLLYVGTEFGLYISTDGGGHWSKWTHGVPTVPVRGLIVHPRDDALVVGTHGRAAYVLDDVRPLRELTESVRLKRLHLFPVGKVVQHQVKQVGGYRFTADGMFKGQNRPYGAMISYYVGEPADGAADESAAKLEILDAAGSVIRTIEGSSKPGLHRTTWDLSRDAPRSARGSSRPSRFGPSGPEVPAGNYTLRLSLGDHQVEGAVEVLPDPRIETASSDRRRKFEALMRVIQRGEVIAEAVQQLSRTQEGIDAIVSRLDEREDEQAKQLKKEAAELKKKLTDLSYRFVDPPEQQGIHARDRAISNKYRYVRRSMGSSWDAPTAAQLTYLRQADALLEGALADFNKLFSQEVARFLRNVQSARVDWIPRHEKLDLEWTKD